MAVTELAWGAPGSVPRGGLSTIQPVVNGTGAERASERVRAVVSSESVSAAMHFDMSGSRQRGLGGDVGYGRLRVRSRKGQSDHEPCSLF